jgi:uncharacterized protein
MKILAEFTPKTEVPQQDATLKWSVWNDIIPVNTFYGVVFNTVSRNAVLVQREYFQKAVEDLPEQEQVLLYQLGILVDASRDERAEQISRFTEGKEDLSYLDLTILVTHNCNMHCTYCFEGSKEKVVMNSHTMSAIIRLLERHSGVCRKLRVTWFGGEPLLAFAQIRQLSQKIIQLCKARGIDYIADITTNGLALTPDRCKELIEECKVRRYIITIDGPAYIHDHRRPLKSGLPTFEKIWGNINTLVDQGAWVTIRMTIDRENRPYVPDFLQMLAKSPLKGKIGLSFCRTIDFNFTPDSIKNKLYSEEEWGKEEWELIQKAHDLDLWTYSFPHAAPRGGCLRRGDITIAATGIIYKCLDTVGDERWVCSHIDEIDKAPMPAWYQQWLNWNPMKDDRCSNCVLQPLCNGGCPHNALYRDKKHGTSLQCPDWRANYRNQIVAIAKTYLSDYSLI